jgi:hypothetical protein
MKKTILLAFFFLFNISLAQAGAGGHAGHGGGGSGGGASCIKARLGKFTPEHLETAAPESEFSFRAFNVQHPDEIEVTIKNEPIDVTFEDKDAFILVKGKLPAIYKNTTVRINIKINSKISKCDAEGGWLLKVTE